MRLSLIPYSAPISTSVFIMPFARYFLVSQLHAPVGSPLVDVTLKDKDCVCV